jgi:hypothetical protein
MWNINERDFRRIDLNVLLVFTALMRERSVSRAAECWRRSKFDPPCRSNTDPGMDAGRMTANCG